MKSHIPFENLTLELFHFQNLIPDNLLLSEIIRSSISSINREMVYWYRVQASKPLSLKERKKRRPVIQMCFIFLRDNARSVWCYRIFVRWLSLWRILFSAGYASNEGTSQIAWVGSRKVRTVWYRLFCGSAKVLQRFPKQYIVREPRSLIPGTFYCA